MTVRDVIEALDLKIVAGEAYLDRDIGGGYVGDLLSCVMATARPGQVWVTVQAHPNVVAVATLAGVSAVIVTEGKAVDLGTTERADREGIPVLCSHRTSFEVVARLVEIGVRGG